jgi:guanyl-specific ribonuclease Sa
VDNGSLKKVIADNPKIFQNFKADNDPVLNHAAKLELAYKIARGDQTVQQVTKAVETGKKQATDTAKKVAASRVAPGSSPSGFSKPPSEAGKLVNDIVSGGGSKFSKAVASQLRK